MLNLAVKTLVATGCERFFLRIPAGIQLGLVRTRFMAHMAGLLAEEGGLI
jgi:hypothetical protein